MYVVAALASFVVDVPAGWSWKSDTPICSLHQQTSESFAAIDVARTPANDETEVTISLPRGLKLRGGRWQNVQLTFTPSVTFSVNGVVGEGLSGDTQIYLVSPDARVIEEFGRSASISLAHPNIPTQQIPIVSAQEAYLALKECEDRKMTEWGIAPQEWRSLARRPYPVKEVRERFQSLDYPSEAVRRNIEADAVIRLDIGADGKVSRCTAVNVEAKEFFEKPSCNVLRGARFLPALNAQGLLIAAPILVNVRYRLAQ